jgi:predicted DNA-binding protein
MSTITFEIQPEKERQLEALATKNGKDVAALLREIIDALLSTTEILSLRDQSFDKILDPFRRGFAESGIAEGELSDLLESELKSVRAERRIRRAANG